MVPIGAYAVRSATRHSASATFQIPYVGRICFALCLCLTGPGVAFAEPHHIRTAAVQSDEPQSDGSTLPSARNIEIEIGDKAFAVTTVSVRAGETVRFVIRNTSAGPRDFTVGTPEMQRIRRGFLARMIPSGDQSISPAERQKLESWNAVVVLPGESRELVWTVTATEDVEFRSNIPGQHAAGMKGKFQTGPVARTGADEDPADRTAHETSEPAEVREGEDASKNVHPSLQHHVRLSALGQRVRSLRQRRKISRANRQRSGAGKPVSVPRRKRIIVRTNFNGGTNGGAYLEEDRIGAVDKGARGTSRRTSARAVDAAAGNGGEPNISGSSGAGLGTSGGSGAGPAGAGGIGVAGFGGAGLSGGPGKGGAGGPGKGGAGGPGKGGAGGPGKGGTGGPGKGGAGGPGKGGGGPGIGGGGPGGGAGGEAGRG